MTLAAFLLQPARVSAQAEISNSADAKALYDRMVENARTQDYEGILTYEQAGQMQSYRVVSSKTGDGLDQTLSLLDGPRIDHSMHFGANCKALDPPDSGILSRHYNFFTRGDARVAGLFGKEVVLMPVDKYRNGYRFVIDKESGLMLRSEVTTPDRRVVERIQFVSLRVAQATETSGEATSAEPEAAEVVPPASDVDCEPIQINNGWRAAWLPQGFDLLKSSLDGERAILVYGDGLSVVSVFIEPVQETFLPPSNAQRGATSLYINYLSNPAETYLVSVVGEVPMTTAERILASLRKE